jgi:hypothetical protein
MPLTSLQPSANVVPTHAFITSSCDCHGSQKPPWSWVCGHSDIVKYKPRRLCSIHALKGCS